MTPVLGLLFGGSVCAALISGAQWVDHRHMGIRESETKRVFLVSAPVAVICVVLFLALEIF